MRKLELRKQNYPKSSCSEVVEVKLEYEYVCCCSVAESCPTLCDPMNYRIPCPSLSPGVFSNSCLLKNIFLLCKPPSFWYFVITAQVLLKLLCSGFCVKTTFILWDKFPKYAIAGSYDS